MPRTTRHAPHAKLKRLLLVVLTAVLAGCATRVPPEATWAGRLPEADTVRVAELRPGVRHAYLWLDEGPWAVHVLEVDGAICAPDVRAARPGPPLSARATTSALSAGAMAAINADFFMLPEGTPLGAHVRAGRVLAGPGDRPVHARDAREHFWAGPAVLTGFVATPGDTVVLAQVNRAPSSARHRPSRAGVRLYDAWFSAEAPPDSGPTVRVRRLTGRGSAATDAAVSPEVARGVVTSLHPPGDQVLLDGSHVAIQGGGPGPSEWLDGLAVGDTVSWRGTLVPQREGAERSAGAVEAVGGFPILVSEGRGVYAEQVGVSDGFGEARHPRTAVGWNAAERLFWVVVDGRQAPYSDGMSLPELEWLFLRLGATEAINLDGGGSSTMVVEGRVVNRPSDPDERPVGNALVLRGCQSDQGEA